MWALPVSPDVEIGGVKVKNVTVNLIHCKTIIGYTEENCHVEGEPYKMFKTPAIEFRGCDVRWFFKTEKERDDELARLYKSLELEC